MAPKISWRCLPCWKINSQTCDFCPSCGLSWKKIHDPSYVDPKLQTDQSQSYESYSTWDDWYASPWKGSSNRAHTPRQQRPNSPHGRQKGKNKGKGKGKKEPGKGAGDKSGKGTGDKHGKGAKYSPATLPPEPAPNWAASSPAAPKEPTTPKKLSPAEQRLQELTEALQADDNALSSRVQALLADHAQKTEQETAKEELEELQGAASKVYQAKKQLSTARLARQALYHTWNVHISDSLTRWRGYASEFQEQDKAISAKIEEASAALATAQQLLDDAKDNQAVPIEVSDTEITEKPGAASAIMEGMNEMVRSFEAVQQRAEAFAADQPPVKKHKGDGGEDAAVGKLGSGALTPFGGARRSTPQWSPTGRHNQLAPAIGCYNGRTVCASRRDSNQSGRHVRRDMSWPGNLDSRPAL